MSCFTYENQGTNTYLVYTLEDDEKLDSMSLGMITNNEITGLAPAIFMQVNTTRYIKYNVSSKIPVNQFFSETVKRKTLLGVFNGIVEAMAAAEEYMINTSTILVDTEYIYADVSNGETIMICLPVQEKEQKGIELGTFFKRIMFDTRFDQTENCDYVTKLINYLNSISFLSLTDFRKFLKELQKEQDSDTDLGSLKIVVKDSSQLPLVQPVLKEEQQILSVGQDVNQTEPGEQGADISNVQENVDTKEETGEKAMSLFYLLRHYDKENANLYREQRNGKKISKKIETVEKEDKKSKKEKKKKEKKTDRGRAKITPGFSIPGQGKPAEYAEEKFVQEDSQAHPSLPILQEQQVVRRAAGTADFGNTVFVDQDMEDNVTVMLDLGDTRQETTPYLVCKKNNEIIPINKAIFRLGRNPEYNDYVIAGNDFVGNSHCHIVVKEEGYFLVDNNSKNHTYIDGMMIPPGKEVKLSHGQRIVLANEEFEFHLF